MPPIDGWKTGVYCWLNKTDGKRYVGSSMKSLAEREYHYRRHFKRGRCHNSYLLRAWNKYGESAFDFIVLEKCSPSRCLEREEYWMDYFKSYKREYGYNIYIYPGKGNLGLVMSLETRQKLSDAKRGVKWTDVMRQSILDARSRNPKCMARNTTGVLNPRCTLSESDVIRILKWPDGYNGKLQDMAEEMKVGMPIVQAIRSGRCWKHLYKHHSRFNDK